MIERYGNFKNVFEKKEFNTTKTYTLVSRVIYSVKSIAEDLLVFSMDGSKNRFFQFDCEHPRHARSFNAFNSVYTTVIAQRSPPWNVCGFVAEILCLNVLCCVFVMDSRNR